MTRWRWWWPLAPPAGFVLGAMLGAAWTESWGVLEALGTAGAAIGSVVALAFVASTLRSQQQTSELQRLATDAQVRLLEVELARREDEWRAQMESGRAEASKLTIDVWMQEHAFGTLMMKVTNNSSQTFEHIAVEPREGIIGSFWIGKLEPGQSKDVPVQAGASRLDLRFRDLGLRWWIIEPESDNVAAPWVPPEDPTDFASTSA